jgi:hypothetical protein
MFEISDKSGTRVLFCLLVLAGSFCLAGEPLDRSKYISIDEIQPGMKGYCLTIYKGTEVEKFDLDVASVVRNVAPGRNAILVQSTDERFIHTGPVAGCSGSPVYIDGRLAGALAFGWIFSKDPLYGVTPIEEMLQTGRAGASSEAGHTKYSKGFAFDFSRPIDFAEINREITRSAMQAAEGRKTSFTHNSTNATVLPSPLITSGLPAGVCEQLNTLVEPFGFMAVSGIGGGTDFKNSRNVRLVPGASIAVPLVTGDISMDVLGTVTEVSGNKVYAFGHSFLGYGAVNLPMATGYVHTVVSSLSRSFKFGSSLNIVGAVTVDESVAICGQIGAKPRMIPLTIRVDRYNDVEKRVYNCRLADNQVLTPLVLGAAVAGAALRGGDLPPDNTVEYKAAIHIEGAESISFENISANTGLNEIMWESVGSTALLLNNPYRKVDVNSIEFDICLKSKDIASRIWSIDLSDSKVNAGQKLDVSVVLESALADKKKYRFTLNIPENLAPGMYELIVCGGAGYQEFLKQNVPYKFIPQSLPTLIEAANNVLRIDRGRLYCLLVLPRGGIAVEKAELPDLPPTKALVLQDPKRILTTQSYPHWLEESLKTGTVVTDKKVTRIQVEK